MDWKNGPLSHKIATVIACIAVVVALVPMLKPGLLPVDLTYPAITVVTLCEAVIYWNERRKWAYLLIASAVICFGSFMLELLLL